MKIAIPVECQNGHKAKWIICIDGLVARHEGVPTKEKCNCPKWQEGQGYTPCGKPEVASV
ncbi:hypothetical protein NLU14_08675 [Marinobacter sp. 71-i]|uniref:Uncharacterized protein n=1 Tax=Marinobacter iranensis TaxID=2962607 RepID=A0ABT5Y9D9_9GAMM|nr:hypothetical protein [Marinobacter iranensis]MDF0750303.1 hypothetical protein [Marinobacter iranensis]